MQFRRAGNIPVEPGVLGFVSERTVEVGMRSSEATRAVDGWPSELVDLFRTRRSELTRLAYLLIGRRTVAEEIVQDAFISTYRSWDRVQNPWRYLRTAVVNGCNSWGRHQAVAKSHPPDDPGHDRLEADEMWDALQTLEESRRAAIVLRYYLDLPHSEIAELLGCPAATVRTSIHRGLKQLRKEIES